MFTRFQIWVISVSGFMVAAPADPLGTPTSFNGSTAFNYTRKSVSFGERPSGSDAMTKQRQWIAAELKKLGCTLAEDEFQAQTPKGPLPMVNIVARFPGSSGRLLAVTGHYDTKSIPNIKFLGANDGGSSTGFLLEFARFVSSWNHSDEIDVVFFDGEEAVHEWSDNDSRYGSRHLAEKWLADGTIRKLKALINVDMIGDRDLDLINDQFSSATLRERVRAIANSLGYSASFRGESAIDDDHKPFADLGANAIDLIDFDYGSNNAYWHTEKDTMDKLSAKSLQVVGDIVVALVKQLDGNK